MLAGDGDIAAPLRIEIGGGGHRSLLRACSHVHLASRVMKRPSCSLIGPCDFGIAGLVVPDTLTQVSCTFLRQGDARLVAANNIWNLHSVRLMRSCASHSQSPVGSCRAVRLDVVPLCGTALPIDLHHVPEVAAQPVTPNEQCSLGRSVGPSRDKVSSPGNGFGLVSAARSHRLLVLSRPDAC